jgi:hypothetical protein
MDPLSDLVEKDRVARVVNDLFMGTDARAWARVEACFAPSVTFDMSSVGGGAPRRLSAAEITKGWETGLAAVDHVHHQTGNLVVQRGDAEANASCQGIAYHYRKTRFGRNTRIFVGTYEFHLVLVDGSWKIDLMRFELKFVDGNVDLEKEPPA